jgi:enamine deaminase RidA (YjgF/YER057c/UK114 family)
MRILPITLLLAGAVTAGSAAEIQRINPEGLSKPNRFSHVVIAKGEKTIYISGQTSHDANGKLIGKGDLAVQTDQAYKNLRIALAASGATFADVVKMTLFIVNLRPEMMDTVRSVRDRYIPANFPASTAVGVQALGGADYLIEIDAIAVK